MKIFKKLKPKFVFYKPFKKIFVGHFPTKENFEFVKILHRQKWPPKKNSSSCIKFYKNRTLRHFIILQFTLSIFLTTFCKMHVSSLFFVTYRHMLSQLLWYAYIIKHFDRLYWKHLMNWKVGCRLPPYETSFVCTKKRKKRMEQVFLYT